MESWAAHWVVLIVWWESLLWRDLALGQVSKIIHESQFPSMPKRNLFTGTVAKGEPLSIRFSVFLEKKQLPTNGRSPKA